MANSSSAVSTGQTITAAQYNNLRTDAIGPYGDERVFPDSTALKFGTGEDVTFLYDGTNLVLDYPVVAAGQAFVINEVGADVDLRIEGDTDANLFFLDAGNDRVGIGTAAPAVKLHVVGGARITGDLDHDGSNVGFFGTAPAAQAAAYTPTNVVTDRAYDADATTVAELADVLGTLIADLQSYGLLQ